MLNTMLSTSSVAQGTTEAPYVFLPGSLTSGVLLLCDHADNAFPDGYGTLGLASEQLERHIAYDPGAAAITRRMAELLGAPAVMTRYSRLLIDPNRGEDDPTLIMRLSDGAIVPGNARITEAEIRKRIDLYYRPYHSAVEEAVDAMIAAGKPPVIFSIHSFTENWRGWLRPWHAGVLWDRDPRLAVPLIEALRADAENLVVGDNEPYMGALRGDCVHKHATSRGLANALIEVRQDLIRHEDGAAHWAVKLSAMLTAILAKHDRDATLHTVRYYGSRTDRTGRVSSHIVEEDGAMPKPQIDPETATALEAAVFRKLVAHLRERGDVQNIDMMNLAGFCRNCLSNWYQEAAKAAGIEIGRDAARELVYGMPYDEWKARHQTEATPEQKARFAANESGKHQL
jgi:predicted N-formylglutamate amidohydrolase